MNISFEIPQDIEEQLRAEGEDLGREAKEAFFVELYRRRKINHPQLGKALELDRFDTDYILKQHDVGNDLTLEEFRKEVTQFDEVEPQ